MTAGSYTQRDVVVSVELPDGRIVHPVAFDTSDFLQARLVTSHEADGGAINATAMWWPTTIPRFGATWMLHYTGTTRRSGPAVVDDFGDLVLVGVATVKPRICLSPNQPWGYRWQCYGAGRRGYGCPPAQAYFHWFHRLFAPRLPEG